MSGVLAPTRAEFLTGRYYPKTGVSGVSTGQERLNVDETTIADIFKKSGYATGAFGKWHNGTQPPTTPIIEALTNTTDLPPATGDTTTVPHWITTARLFEEMDTW